MIRPNNCKFSAVWQGIKMKEQKMEEPKIVDIIKMEGKPYN
jgi:hypothetical protein